MAKAIPKFLENTAIKINSSKKYAGKNNNEKPNLAVLKNSGCFIPGFKNKRHIEIGTIFKHSKRNLKITLQAF